jgi:protoporphyrinogen oxidase
VAEVVILGAGLTGLSAAYKLEQRNYLDYEIFEQDIRPGGLLKTESVGGFNFDYTGHLLHISNPEFKAFLEDLFDFDQDLVLNKRHSAIFYSNTFVPYPFQMNLFGLPADVIYDCINGYINRKTGLRKTISFYDWVLKYFGAGFGKHFFFPYNGKLLSCDVKDVLASWVGRFVPQTSLKLILNGAIQKRTDQGVGYNSFFYYPKNGGIELLVKNITSKLKKKIRTGHRAVFIDLEKKVIFFENGHSEPYNKLVTTIPLKELLLGTKSLNHLAPKLLCSSVINFNLGFNKPDIGSWHWIYFPEKQVPFYRLGFWNNISQSCVKHGGSGIYGEVSYLHGTKARMQTDHLTYKSEKETLKFLGLTRGDIIAQKRLHMPYAYVIYDLWREKNLPKIFDTLAQVSVFSVGRFGGWNYSSMQEAFIDGALVADRVLREIRQTFSRSGSNEKFTKVL